jgi:outer membrane protein OmpA-like peptidoglycan-associated protein
MPVELWSSGLRRRSSDTMPDMRRLTTGRGAVSGATLLSVAALTMITTTAPAAASLPPAAGAPSVPILGQVALKENSETGRSSAVAALHGVRRIPGGTVIYYSIGYSSSNQGSTNILGLDKSSPAFSRAKATTSFAKTMLVDAAGKKVYTGLMRSGNTSLIGGKSDCICSDVGGVDVLGYEKGQANVLYQVVAALPDSVQSVDVFISGQVIGQVKVDNGPMTPEVDSSKPILVGMGWPKVDESAVASSVEPAKSVIDLTTSVANLEQTVTTRATPKQISVALASDVLFATDSATLSPKAQAVLGRAAVDVKAAGGAGTLQVIGYTDNTGSAAHNVDLSRRRAAAVAAALKPLLGAGVGLPTSGRGEADPVTPNTTAEGRALNRRVSVVFAPSGGAK